MGEGGIRRMMEGLNSNKIYLLNCKNFCRCYNVFPWSTTKSKIYIREVRREATEMLLIRDSG
jgi:hypothetical protein